MVKLISSMERTVS